MNQFRPHAIAAVWRKQISSLLFNPLGYVFILAYVLIYAGVVFLPDEYFQRNIADLGPILDVMPWLLVVLLPSVSMGSWASERELGTDEQILTLPVSELDVLLGKWLAIVSYFTVALLCSLTNVWVLSSLGEADGGLIATIYLGWWLLGITFAAASLFASTLVSLPAVAFVLGALLCALLTFFEGSTHWMGPFERGVVSLGQVAVALTLTIFFIGLAVLSLGSKRWQWSRRKGIVVGVVSFLAITVTAFNLSVQIDRAAVDIDMTDEGLSSLSDASVSILDEQKTPVKVTAFISMDLPPEQIQKGSEVLNMLTLLQRQAGDQLNLVVHRPEDPLDELGSLATQHFGLKPRRVTAESVTGKEEIEIFMGAVIESGAKRETIAYFEPGLSVEYELLRAIRTTTTAKKKVIGIADTDLKITQQFDFTTRQMSREWQLVQELRKQYEVQSVKLDVPVQTELAALVVPQPSSLTDEQLKNLHEYIYKGGPTLLLEDPASITAPDLSASLPRPQRQPTQPGQPPQQDPPKGDLKPLFTSLGVDLDPQRVIWSDVNPSHELRNRLPKQFVWAQKEKGAIEDVPALTGIGTVLFPYAGALSKAEGAASMTFTKLVTVVPSAAFGSHGFGEVMRQSRSLFGPGPLRPVAPEVHTPTDGDPFVIAAELTGKMARAYDAPAPAEGELPAEDKKGAVGDKKVHVILVADTDFFFDEFFMIYRNQDKRFDEDDARFLQDLRNVQFASNLVDALAGDEAFLKLRTRRPKARPLATLEELMDTTQKRLLAVEAEAKDESDTKIKKLQEDLDKRVKAVEGQEGLDDKAKGHLQASIQQSAQRQLTKAIEGINRASEAKVREAKVEQRRAVEEVRDKVRLRALGVPGAILCLLALGVWLNRRRDEKLTIPESRKRRTS
jgi:ABC-2 type transport system permease protein